MGIEFNPEVKLSGANFAQTKGVSAQKSMGFIPMTSGKPDDHEPQDVTVDQFGNKTISTLHKDGSRTDKVFDKDNKLTKTVIYKDVNGDGKQDIYSVTNFNPAREDTDYTTGEKIKVPASSVTYIDKDGDGYNDVRIERTFDEKGNIKSEKTENEEDINLLKSRNPAQWKIKNREMSAHVSNKYVY